MSETIAVLATVMVPIIALIVGPEIALWNHRRRERVAALQLKQMQDKYHADCRRTGHYDY